MNAKSIVRDAAIVLVLTFFGGFVIGFANPYGNNAVAIAVSNTIFSSIGFFIAGCLKKEARFQHLSKVVLLVWLASALNIFFGVSIVQWIASILFLYVTMGVGGGLSFIFVKAQEPNQQHVPPMHQSLVADSDCNEIDALIKLLNENPEGDDVCEWVRELERRGYDRESLEVLVADRGHDELARELSSIIRQC